jgi:hypothetical protein
MSCGVVLNFFFGYGYVAELEGFDEGGEDMGLDKEIWLGPMRTWDSDTLCYLCLMLEFRFLFGNLISGQLNCKCLVDFFSRLN